MAHSAHRPNPSLVIATAVGVLAITLAACGPPSASPSVPSPSTANLTSSAPAEPAPTTIATTEPPTSAPTTSLPARPSDATWSTVEEFFAAYTRGLQTGDASRLTKLSTEDCASCEALAAEVAALKSEGIVGTGGKITFARTQALRTPHKDRFVWRTTYTQAPVAYTYPDPDHSYKTDPVSSVAYIELTQKNGAWRISGISGTTDGAP